MVKVRLRTKFLLSMVLITAGLTAFSLLLVRRSIQSQVKQEIFADLQNSVTTFESFQREEEITLSHSADLVADLPDLRALMTTEDPATIQDGSLSKWKLAGSDLFVLADRAGKVVALHTNAPDFTPQIAQASFNASLDQQQRWWMGAQRLYEVFLKPIYFGPASEGHLLGFLVIGREIDQRVAAQISRIASSKVVFRYGQTIVTSTLSAEMGAELARTPVGRSSGKQPELLQLGNERYLATTLDLSPENQPAVRLTVLKSYDEATAFLQKLNRLLLLLGLLAVLIGSALVFLISHTFTRPLSSLLKGVAALEQGDFDYALHSDGSDEAAELARAFDRMRDSLRKTQQSLIESERLATIGRMASSISHDLRHSLAAIIANAEFLCDSNLTREQRDELYHEVQLASHRMTDLIESLLEFSRTRASVRPTHGSLRAALDQAIQAVRANPEFHNVRFEVRQSGPVEGWFDHHRLERAFFNLLLNACQSLPDRTGQIEIELRDATKEVEIRIRDHGRGIPESIRASLFEPFVSEGKQNGTGLGLTVVQKIVQDHAGVIAVESTSSQGTIFRIVLPRPTPGAAGGNTEAAEEASSRLELPASSARATPKV
ncbi:MAG TPA: ATP-binding protein [Terriglobales bacterium]